MKTGVFVKLVLVPAGRLMNYVSERGLGMDALYVMNSGFLEQKH